MKKMDKITHNCSYLSVDSFDHVISNSLMVYYIVVYEEYGVQQEEIRRWVATKDV
jgi:hypothetical protein